MTRFVSLFIFATALVGCSREPICPCENNSNPCREAEDELFPLATVMRAYEGTSIGKILPAGARTTPAKVLYALLENGNANDASTWYVGPSPAAKWSDGKETSYSGYIEVFPLENKKGAQCRKFIQKIEMRTKSYGDFSFEGHGESCKRYPGSWRIVKEVQL